MHKVYKDLFSVVMIRFLFFILLILCIGPLLVILKANKLSEHVNRFDTYSVANINTHVVQVSGHVKDSPVPHRHNDSILTASHQGLKSGEYHKISETRLLLEAENHTDSSSSRRLQDSENLDKKLDVKDFVDLKVKMAGKKDHPQNESSRNTTNLATPDFENDSANPKAVQHVGVEPAMARIHDATLQYFSFQDNDQRDSFVNLHRIGYDTDSKACADPVDVLVLVHSKFNNNYRRTIARTTWAHNKTVYGVRFSVVFFLGQPPSVSNNTAGDQIRKFLAARRGSSNYKTDADKRREVVQGIVNEGKTYGDIVMGNFTDAYRNLTIKHIMALGWALSHCPKVKYIIKMDDDTILNTYSVARYVKSDFSNVTGLLLCNTITEGKVFRMSSKWTVENTEFPFSIYPPYCSGYGIIMTSDVVQRLYDSSQDVRPFWVDDVYVTGLVAWRAGVTPVQLKDNMSSVVSDEFLPDHVAAIFVTSRIRTARHEGMYWQQMVAAQEHDNVYV